MSYLRWVILFFLAALLQWGWSTYFSFFGLSPQIFLILTIIAAAKRGAVAAMCFGFMWGLCLDVFEVRLFGANALAFTLVGYGVGMARRQIDVAAFAPMALLLIHGTWGYFLLKGLLGLIFIKYFSWVGWFSFSLDPLLNCLMLPMMLGLWNSLIGASQ